MNYFNNGVFCRIIYAGVPYSPPLFFPSFELSLDWYGKCVGDVLSHLPDGFKLDDYKLELVANYDEGKFSSSRKRKFYDYHFAHIDEQYKEVLDRYEVSKTL